MRDNHREETSRVNHCDMTQASVRENSLEGSGDDIVLRDSKIILGTSSARGRAENSYRVSRSASWMFQTDGDELLFFQVSGCPLSSAVSS